jgi:hypothetical protein
MNLRNSLMLFLAFLFTTSLAYAGKSARPDRMQQGKPVVCSASKDYNVGDRGPTNGWIIYKKPAASGQSENTCWQYLEAAPVDVEGTRMWSNVYGEGKLVGGTGTGIGDGKENTKKIMAQAGHTQSAAKTCDDFIVKYNGKTFGDWFLPSRDELDLMYQLLAKGDNKGGFKTKYDEAKNIYPWYWSSFESLDGYAWIQNFYDGVQLGYYGDIKGAFKPP